VRVCISGKAGLRGVAWQSRDLARLSTMDFWDGQRKQKEKNTRSRRDHFNMTNLANKNTVCPANSAKVILTLNIYFIVHLKNSNLPSHSVFSLAQHNRI
jgi:hypothetical protein